MDIGGKRGDSRYILLLDVTEDHTMGWISPVWTRTMGKHHDASQEEISSAKRGQGPSRYARLSNGFITLDSSELILTLRHKFHCIVEGRFELYVFYWQSLCYSLICTSSENKEEDCFVDQVFVEVWHQDNWGQWTFTYCIYPSRRIFE